MNTSTIAALLQTTAAILMSAHNNSQMSAAQQQAIVTAAGQTVQVATHAMAVVPFTVTTSTTIYPGSRELDNAPYIDASGAYVRQGGTVQLQEGAIAYGDMNSDGWDDAAATVLRTAADGSTSYALGVFLNQGNSLFNIADRPLGTNLTVYSLRITSGKLWADMKVGAAARTMYEYELLGNTIVKD